MQHDPFEPSFIVDVTAAWPRKLESLAAYDSQLHQPTPKQGAGKESKSVAQEEPVTKVSTPDFRLAIEGRARHFGQMIGATFGEPFWGRLPLAVANPLSVLPGGVL